MKIIRRHFSTLDSTIQWAREHLGEWDREGITLVTADEQTAGIGSRNRKWVSPPGKNIAASFCFFLEEQRQDLMNLPQLLQLVTAEILEGMGFDPVIKWPNDLLLSRKKLGGVLCHTFMDNGQVCVILSIGLNVNSGVKAFEGIDQPATSLFIEGGKEIDREELTEQIGSEFSERLEEFLEKGFNPFIDSLRKHLCLKPGDPVSFTDHEGTFVSINDDGSLNLKLPSGEVKTVY